MRLEKLFIYNDLSRKAKRKACKDYLDGWLETHEDDVLCLNEIDAILIHHEGEFYLEDGTLIGDFD
jgi:hypothetical protein